MKVSNDVTGSAAPSRPVDTSAPDSRTSGSKSSETKSFDDVLARKNAERKAEDNLETTDGTDYQLSRMSPVPFSTLPNTDLAAIEKPSSGESKAPDFTALVQEIVVAAAPGKDPNVEIKFQSNTLEGLNVQVAKKGDEISIRCLTSSSSVAQLLTRNSDQLSQGLASKGLRVGVIQIETAPVPSRQTGSRSAPRDGGRNGTGDQRQPEQQK